MTFPHQGTVTDEYEGTWKILKVSEPGVTADGHTFYVVELQEIVKIVPPPAPVTEAVQPE